MIQNVLVTCLVYFPAGFLLLLSLFLLERYLSYKKLCKKYAHIPGYTQFLPPQLASLFPKWMLPENVIVSPYETLSIENIVKTIKTVKSDYYKIIFGILNMPLIIADSPEIAKEVATKGAKLYKKTFFSNRTFLEMFLGTNVFAEPDHQTWLHQRQLIDQSFAPSNLKLVAQVTNEVMDKDMIPTINSNLEKRDVMVDFANLTMDVIGKAAFGYALDSFHTKPGEETMDQKTTIFLANADFLRLVPSKFLRANLKFGPIAKIHNVVDSFRDIIRKIIEKRERNGVDENEETADVLSLLLKERKNNRENSSGGILTDDELVSNAFVLLVAGHETTAKNLGFALYLLSKNPHIQKEFHEAADKLVQETGRESFDFSDYESGRLDYFKAVFNEALRLIPVAFGIFRELPKNVDIDGVTFPKGSLFTVSFVNTLVNEKYWEDPLEFKPMRFIKDGKFVNPHTNPFIFTPFGIGGRICAGRYFSLIEGMCALAKLARNYSFKLSDPSYVMKTEMVVTMRPTKTLLIDFIPRQ